MPQASTTADALPYSARPQHGIRSKRGAAIWNGIAHAARTLAARYQERQRVRGAMAELSALSDAMLKDIGIVRSHIPRVARYGRDWTGGQA